MKYNHLKTTGSIQIDKMIGIKIFIIHIKIFIIHIKYFLIDNINTPLNFHLKGIITPLYCNLKEIDDECFPLNKKKKIVKILQLK